jgi:hypothetical protein
MFVNICGYVYWRSTCDRNCPHLNANYATRVLNDNLSLTENVELGLNMIILNCNYMYSN